MKSKSQRKNQTAMPVLLTPAQLKSRQNELLIIDVRSWFEYWIGHIPGAQRFSQHRVVKDIPKDRAIVVTCLSGHRSAITAQWLIAQGYRRVYNLQGGLLAWQSAGYPVQRGLSA